MSQPVFRSLRAPLRSVCKSQTRSGLMPLSVASRFLSTTTIPNTSYGGSSQPGVNAGKPPGPAKSSWWERVWSNKWIEPEAEYLVYLGYKRHSPLSVSDMVNVDYEAPPMSKAQLEALGDSFPTYPAKTIGDKFARIAVRALIPINHLVFRDKYNHHACVLETVAAVPGMVGALFRHMKSLRTMKRDHGWINPLLEEAENERMHLLTWMQTTQPTPFEKLIVLGAQALYATIYASMYLLAPQVAHRFVGYLEEEAVIQYTHYLKALDSGKLPNVPAPAIAKRYWNLPDDATIRDVVLVVRADETMHRNFNHHLAEMYATGRSFEEPLLPPRELEAPPKALTYSPEPAKTK